jgi:hypothetical protein
MFSRHKNLRGGGLFGSDPFCCGPARHAYPPWPFPRLLFRYAHLSRCPSSPTQRLTYLLSRSLFLTARPRSTGSPKPLQSKIDAHLVFRELNSCFFTKNRCIQRYMLRILFYLSVCAFHVIFNAWIV